VHLNLFLHRKGNLEKKKEKKKPSKISTLEAEEIREEETNYISPT